jgi:hypothetical protein
MLLGIEPLGDMQQRDDTRTVYAADRELQSRSSQRYCLGQYPGVKRIDGTTARVCMRRYGTVLHHTGTARWPAHGLSPVRTIEPLFRRLAGNGGGLVSGPFRGASWANRPLRECWACSTACTERRPTTRDRIDPASGAGSAPDAPASALRRSGVMPW